MFRDTSIPRVFQLSKFHEILRIGRQIQMICYSYKDFISDITWIPRNALDIRVESEKPKLQLNPLEYLLMRV